MKKLILGFVIAVSLMMGLAGAAGAVKPDCNAFNASGHGLTTVIGLIDGECEDHSS